MNADHVDRVVALIGDGPGSIRGLRRLAVGLAVGGKLGGGDHDADFQAVTEALHRSPEGKFDQWSVATDDLPASLGRPEHFVRLGTVARIEKGRTGIQAAAPGPYPLVVTAEHRQSCDHFDFDGAAAIVPLVSSAGHGKASLQRLHYQEGRFALGTILAAIFPKDPQRFSARFLFEYLSAFKDDLLVSRMLGTANVTLTIAKLSDVPIPSIAAAVQARVDQIMGLCDRLEAARTAREATRDRLTAASLARLSASDMEPKDFLTQARSVVATLPALTTRPDQIKPLRQTILNLAAGGKLVGQDPTDEPASELLERITSARAAMKGNKGHRNKDQVISIVPSSVAIPHRWESVRLDAISTFENGDRSSNYPSGPDLKSDGIPFFSTKNLSDHRLGFANLEFISPAKFSSLRSGKLKDLDILITLRGSVGKFGLFKASENITTGFINAQLLIIRCLDPEIVPYLVTCMQSEVFDRQIAQLSSGAATPQLSAGKLAEALIPLPPVAEQRRIVAKVDALMALCDRLEAALTATDTSRARLLDALLQDALNTRPLEEAA
ncbi:restriction endonuclease subunit S [Brevundimonas sp.]|uniref:restriction endonuclease subunit S n=1 Tax=Brevundimonas sp. TaxID=1871086 RepID=UPI002731A42A|nr:restriction endonuclease subunit S [Brevundimonas sp.]MDP1912099.1 restriction endonuclease subunit S [Brevundimonas sp.]